MIPYFNRPNSLRRTLRSLKTQKTDHRYEVLVVDDGSDIPPQDVVAAVDRPTRTRFLSQSNVGPSAARALGGDQAQGNIVVFLDCDQIVDPFFVNNHIVPFRRIPDRFMQIGTRRNLAPNTDFSLPLETAKFTGDERVGLFLKTSYNLGNLECAWHLGFSHNMSMRRRDLEAVGGFDPNFVGWGLEDCEITYRFAKNGIPVVLNPNVQALHQPHPKNQTPARYQRWLQNLAYFEAKHPEKPVKAQRVLCNSMNPDFIGPASWSYTMLGLELVLRADTGRPAPAPIAADRPINDFGELSATAKSGNVGQTIARISAKDVELFVGCQIDPAFREVRMAFQ